MKGELPSHFAKAAQSASAVLSGYDYEAIAAKVSACSVTLAFDLNAATTREGKAALGLCADLLARLYPNVDLVGLGPEDDPALKGARLELEAAMRAINPNIEVSLMPRRESRATIVVGQIAVENATVYVGSNGWRCSVSSTTPVGSGDSGLPYAAGVAACIGVANAFRAVFNDQLESDFDQDLSIDLLSWEVAAPPETSRSSVSSCDIGDTFLVGLGAIGHGFVWATALAPELRGSLHLIDDEAYDETNAQRYTGMDAAATGLKVDACASVIRQSHDDLAIEVHPMTWDEFVHAREKWTFDRVLLALDSAEDRRFVQSSLPRWIINAWTQRDNVGVSRHPNFSDAACVCCLYQPEGALPDLDDVVASALGFPADELTIKLIRMHLDLRPPLDSAMLDRIATQKGLKPGALAEFEGKSLDDLYHRGVCGGLILQLGGSLATSDRAAEVPLAFQSALAGIMLAAELYIDAGGLRARDLPCRTEINLLKPIHGTLSSPESKHRSGRCICQDEDYRAAYVTKHPRR